MAVKRRDTLKTLFVLFSGVTCFAQTDTARLNEVVVTAYLQNRPVLRLPASAAVIDSVQMKQQSPLSPVPLLNTVAGVRMEERSPGSYRLSIRGSLIRSPFGIRNTKIYIDEFPLTNGGGETYFNLIDINSIHRIEVLKGPDGSLFGANSGGVVKIIPADLKNNGTRLNAGVGTGSYGLFQQHAAFNTNWNKNNLSLYESWQHADGYRQNSGMDRKFIRIADQWDYLEKAQLRVLFFYSSLNYQTPGGLTQRQFNENPAQARPATATLPGAVEQKAGIANNTLYGGIMNEIRINDRIRHVVAFFGSKTLFENPFITNYETRDETNGGARTWIELKNGEGPIQLTYDLGGETQGMRSQIDNYGNNRGIKDTIQAGDRVTTLQGFVFTRLTVDFYNKWMVEGSLSYQYNQLVFSRRLPTITAEHKQVFDPQLMPRLAVSYLFSRYFSLRAIVSRGYSPPTLQEIRSSDNKVNFSLQPESGWNYEAGWRLMSKSGRIWWDASVYYYKLEHAIVRRSNAAGQEYFVNAGGTTQPGFESQITLQILQPRMEKFVRSVSLTQAYTYQAFVFDDYRSETTNFTGNNLTGVPQHVSVTGLRFDFPSGFYLFTQYNYTARIPLNDANSDYAPEFHLVQARAGWKYPLKNRFAFEVSAGADNLLNQRYSLGNDLNAAGGRYYNAALPRNYYVKLGIWL